jgi:hypothetical protein
MNSLSPNKYKEKKPHRLFKVWYLNVKIVKISSFVYNWKDEYLMANNDQCIQMEMGSR